MKEKLSLLWKKLCLDVHKQKLLSVLLLIFLFTATGAGAYWKSIQNSSIGSPAIEQSESNSNDSNNVIEDTAQSNSNIAAPLSNTKGKLNTNSSTSNTSTGSPASSSDPDSNPATPTPGESPSAVVAFYADTQTDTDAENNYHKTVVNNILATGANPVFHAGDLMEDGTQTSLDYFNDATATLRATRTFYSALGNNDRVVGDSGTPSPLYLANFSFPNNEQWYSINNGNLHMIILDSAFSWNNATQRSWLLSDLQSAASQERITGVMFHHPTFSAEISQTLVDNGADFVITGHNHSYAHTTSGGVNYFVSSGQTSLGYFLARVYSSSVTISVYNSGNSLVETVNIANR